MQLLLGSKIDKCKNMFDYKNKIFILDDVLSYDECNFLINFYHCGNKNKHNTTMHSDNLNFMDNNKIKLLYSKIETAINCLVENSVKIDWCQIVEWEKNSYQNLHYDTASLETCFTSITYLNENFVGGETFMLNDLIVPPKKGRTVCFDGNYYYHGVNKILSGTRYTLPIWYKKNV